MYRCAFEKDDPMDLNELLHAHQVAVIKANLAGNDHVREHHATKLASYAERIRKLRGLRSEEQVALDAESPEMILCASYAGDDHSRSSKALIEDWESEGGSLKVQTVPQISESSVHFYHVGRFVYTDLALATAEHKRQSLAASARGAA